MFPALVTKPELVLARGREKVEEEQMVRSEAGSWRRLPQFSTASDQRRRSYHWRKFPILSRRRSDGKPGRYLIVFNYVDIMYLALLASQAKAEVKIFFYNTMKILIISRGDWLLGARSARAAGLGGLGREAGGRSG